MDDGGGARMTRALDWLVRVPALVAGAILLFQMGLTVVDVVGRYLFNSPLFGAHDLTQMTLIAVIFLAMAECGRARAHVAVDVLTPLLPRGLLRVADVVNPLVAAAAFGVLAWQAWIGADRAILLEAATNMLSVPHAPFYYLMAAGSALFVVVLLAEAVTAARGAGPDQARAGH